MRGPAERGMGDVPVLPDDNLIGHEPAGVAEGVAGLDLNRVRAMPLAPGYVDRDLPPGSARCLVPRATATIATGAAPARRELRRAARFGRRLSMDQTFSQARIPARQRAHLLARA